MIKHFCFPTFLEVPRFVPLNFNVIFRFDFSRCTNVCIPTLLLLWGWALNALVQDQGMHVYEKTVDNYG
jgi:hypothetical protein